MKYINTLLRNLSSVFTRNLDVSVENGKDLREEARFNSFVDWMKTLAGNPTYREGNLVWNLDDTTFTANPEDLSFTRSNLEGLSVSLRVSREPECTAAKCQVWALYYRIKFAGSIAQLNTTTA